MCLFGVFWGGDGGGGFFVLFLFEGGIREKIGCILKMRKLCLKSVPPAPGLCVPAEHCVLLLKALGLAAQGGAEPPTALCSGCSWTQTRP